MRLTCPNCGAQYEVPDDVIPLAGRDVQCSNCGDTWFQSHPQAEIPQDDDPFALSETPMGDTPEGDAAEDKPAFDEVEPPEISLQDEDERTDEADAEGDGLFDEAEEDWDAEDDPWADEFDDPEPDDRRKDHAADEDDTKDDLWDDDAPEGDEDPDAGEDDTDTSDEDMRDLDDAEDDPAPPETPVRRGLDPAVADVLREEAEHEARVRAAETLESQPELGLRAPETESDRRALQAKARMRRLRGLPTEDPEPEAPATDPEPKTGSRRELLPDIEEINSTLRGGGDATHAPGTDAAGPTDVRKKRGFRLGFSIALLIALLAILAYAKHREIAAAYPAAAPYLEGFVASANNGRVWLDSQVTNLFLMLNNFTSGS